MPQGHRRSFTGIGSTFRADKSPIFAQFGARKSQEFALQHRRFSVVIPSKPLSSPGTLPSPSPVRRSTLEPKTVRSRTPSTSGCHRASPGPAITSEERSTFEALKDPSLPSTSEASEAIARRPSLGNRAGKSPIFAQSQELCCHQRFAIEHRQSIAGALQSPVRGGRPLKAVKDA